MEGRYSLRCPAVKRLMKEAQELREPTEQYFAQPLEDNLFEWHFTVRGPSDTEFDGGVYHGRIILPPDYPMKPPSIMLLTPNGRFEVFRKICLSISGHHPESWRPSWSIRTALLAIIGFMPTPGAGAIGSLDYPAIERKKLAKKSQDWTCQVCSMPNKEILPAVTPASLALNEEAKALASQIGFKGEDEKTKGKEAEMPSAPAPLSSKQSALVYPGQPVNQISAFSPSAQAAEIKTVEENKVSQVDDSDPGATVSSSSMQTEAIASMNVRQRVVVPPSEVTFQMNSQRLINENAEHNSHKSLIIMIILSLAIAVLVARRVATLLPQYNVHEY